MLFTFLKDALDSRAAPRGQRLPQHGPGAAARRTPVRRHRPDISRVHEGEVSSRPPRDPRRAPPQPPDRVADPAGGQRLFCPPS